MESTDSNNSQKKNKYKSIFLFIGSFAVALILTWILKEPTFSDSQVYVIFLLFFSIGLWLTEAIPPFAVGIFIMAYLVFALGNKYFNSAPEPIDRYVNTFSSSVVWLLLGGFFLAAATTKTKLDETLMRLTLKVSGSDPKRILICVMITAMLISMVMSNAATTAMLLAAILPFLNTLGKTNLTKALLLGIAVAATAGGMATIIGNPPNALAAGMLEKNGIQVDFLDWMGYGVPLAIVLTALTCWALIQTLVKNSEPASLDYLNEQTSKFSNELSGQRTIVIVVIIVTVLFWLSSSIHGISAAAISAIPLVTLTLTGILNKNDLKGLPWDTLFLVAGGLSLGVALEYTGIMDHYVLKIKTLDVSPFVFIMILAYTAMLLTSIMSDSAASTVFIPMGIAILPEHKESVAVIIGLAASMAMFLPVSTASNSIVYSTGYLEQKDFRVVALIMGLLGPLLAVLWVLFLNK